MLSVHVFNTFKATLDTIAGSGEEGAGLEEGICGTGRGGRGSKRVVIREEFRD